MYTFKYRIYPNKEITKLLIKWFGCNRHIWNWGLDKKIEYYKERPKTFR